MESNSPQFIIAMLGRMGDLIAMEPVFRHLAERYPERRKIWYTRPAYSGIFRFAPFFDEIVEVKNEKEYQEQKKLFPADAVLFEFNMRGAKIDPGIGQFPLLSGLSKNCCPEAIGEAPRFYPAPSIFLPKLPKKYAVFHCSSNSRLRHWPQKSWDELARFCLTYGIGVVEVGEHPILREKGVCHQNGRIDLQLAAGIMAGAEIFVGMESGFGHLANALGIFGIVIAGELRTPMACDNPYTGFYAPSGNGCNMVRYLGEYSMNLPEKIVEEALRKALEGHPMSYTECQLFCRESQIHSLRNHPILRFLRFVNAPFEEMRLRVLAHQAKH